MIDYVALASIASASRDSQSTIAITLILIIKQDVLSFDIMVFVNVLHIA